MVRQLPENFGASWCHVRNASSLQSVTFNICRRWP
ncbi:hypothetical protein FOQG_19434 [Fusarium oxysporum f. sp. raphani 54005]|uniref:Uncharacterized protein n=1 Tax=Fusarium oxysporum f. sp. raphani 54005 TaxID=1089458 RepID=X0BZ40_FUSOX|nr:hypothetical protein FOQG_19434 [Fusarium oxysporum f. sp. raphani 54005]